MIHIAFWVSWPAGLYPANMLSVVGLPIPRLSIPRSRPVPLDPYENVFATHYLKYPQDKRWKRISP